MKKIMIVMAVCFIFPNAFAANSTFRPTQDTDKCINKIKGSGETAVVPPTCNARLFASYESCAGILWPRWCKKHVGAWSNPI